MLMENIVFAYFLFLKETANPTEVTETQSIDIPPVISSEFQLEYYLPIHHSTPLTIHCQVENGNVNFEWYKSFLKLENNQRVTFNQFTGEITFQNITTEDLGIYYCLAKNEFGASVSPFFKISKTGLYSLYGPKEISHTCEEFHHCNLTCFDKPQCQPKNECDVEWKIGIGTLNMVKTNENVTIDSEGNLHFLNVKRVNEAKSYSCGVWNKRLKRLVKGSSINLRVIDAAEKVSPLAIYQSIYKVFVGETAKLQCIFSGIPVPNIEWKNNNESFIRTNHKYTIGQFGRQLQILNVTFDDDGVYKCVTENNLTLNPVLNVTSFPLFPDVQRNFMTKIVNFSTGNDTNLLCDAASAPGELHPIVDRWMKNGKKINQGYPYKLSNDKKTLHIYKMRLTDAGCYTCVAKNSEGIAVANFLLRTDSLGDGEPHDILIIVIVTIFTIVGVILLITVIFKRRICKDRKGREISQTHRQPNSIIHSDATINVYTEPFTEREHIYTEDVEGLNSGLDLQPGDANAEKNYDVLRDCFSRPPDTANSTCYDCSENMAGIYNHTPRRGVYIVSNQSLEETKRVGSFGEQFTMQENTYSYPENVNGEVGVRKSYSNNTERIGNPCGSAESSVFHKKQSKAFNCTENILSGDGLEVIKISKDSNDPQENKGHQNSNGTIIPENVRSTCNESTDNYGASVEKINYTRE